MLSYPLFLCRIIVFFLLCYCPGILAQAATAVCNQKQTIRICLQQTSFNNEIWLWFKPSCKEPCQHVNDKFVSGFRFIEQLPTKEFGMRLQLNEADDMYWTSCSLGKAQPLFQTTALYTITSAGNLDLNTDAIKPELIEDLAQLKPNSEELLRRNQEIAKEGSWARVIFTHTLTFCLTVISIYCCYQCNP